MDGPLSIALTLLAVLGSGLVGGIFFAFSAFVMKALGRLPQQQGLAAMQAINVAVLNPWFFAVFFGTAADCLLLAILALLKWNGSGAIFLLVGSALYLLGGIAVTVAFNVPLNNALAAVRPDSADGAELWRRYLARWTAWNHVRTATTLLATVSFALALP